MNSAAARTISLKENVYGHRKRLEWLLGHVHPDDVILDFGCGTGYMITLQLAKLGFRVVGVDSDAKSIAFGKDVFRTHAQDPDLLRVGGIEAITLTPDVIIVSEVLEHLTSTDLDTVLNALHAKLKPGGKLLVTVPNGYGWFELESFLWYRARLGWLLETLKIAHLIIFLKALVVGRDIEDTVPASLDTSGHVQRFTRKSICRRLESHGFAVLSWTGSVLAAGPFSRLAFTGATPLMRLNGFLGGCCPSLASGFFVACGKRGAGTVP